VRHDERVSIRHETESFTMTDPTQRPFTASTNKFAYAQAFTTQSTKRAERQPRTAGLLHRVTAVRGRAKASRSA
jgi:hypothetical protein